MDSDVLLLIAGYSLTFVKQLDIYSTFFQKSSDFITDSLHGKTFCEDVMRFVWGILDTHTNPGK